jgi:hypothetical protein
MTKGRGLNGTLINPLAEPQSPGIRKHTKSKTFSGDLKGGDKVGEQEIAIMMASHLNIINYAVLPDLGIVDQVFLDKTDTLTLGSMRVAELTSSMKCYALPQTQIDQLINECKANPDAFSYEDDAVKFMESENYSEKSQEYFKELEGEFYPQILNEDSSLEPIVDPKLFPDYRNLTTDKKKDSQPAARIVDSVFSFSESNSRLLPFRRGDENNRMTNTFMMAGFEGSRDSPRDYYEKNSEMKQLNALERKFKQAMMIKPHAPPSNIGRRLSVTKPHAQPGIKSPENEEESGSQLEEEFIGENRINFRIEKKLTDKNFVFDLHSKKDHLLEMLNYLLICNEGSSVI